LIVFVKWNRLLLFSPNVPRTINALSRGELQRGLREATKDAQRLTREISGADSEPVKQAAGVLLKEVRRLLSTPGGGKPAPPGSPPHKQTGALRRSWKQAVVQGVRRVGSGNFRAFLAEFGTEHEAPRPYARDALENVQGQMADVIVQESQREILKVP